MSTISDTHAPDPAHFQTFSDLCIFVDSVFLFLLKAP